MALPIYLSLVVVNTGFRMLLVTAKLTSIKYIHYLQLV